MGHAPAGSHHGPGSMEQLAAEQFHERQQILPRPLGPLPRLVRPQLVEPLPRLALAVPEQCQLVGGGHLGGSLELDSLGMG